MRSLLERLADRLMAIAAWKQVAIGLALGSACIASAFLPRPSEYPWPVLRRATVTLRCLAAANHLAHDGRERLLIEAESFVAEHDGTAWTLDCDGTRLPLTRPPPFSGEVRSAAMSSVLAQAHGQAGLEVVQVCHGCRIDLSPPNDPRTAAWIVRIGGALAGMLGVIFLVAAWSRRMGRTPLRSAFRTAPASAEPGPSPRRLRIAPVDAPEAEALEDVAFTRVARRDNAWAEAAEDETPRIEMPLRDGGYRDVAAGGAELIGPGSVNGLRVPPAERAPLAHHDVVRLDGGEPFRIHLDGALSGLRYRLASGPGELRTLAAGSVLLPGLIAAVAGLAAAWIACSEVSWRLPGALAALVVFAIPLIVHAPERYRQRLLRIDAEGRVHDARGIVAHPRQLRLEAAGETGHRWLAAGKGKKYRLLESVAADRRDPEEAALYAALRREAQIVSDRFAEQRAAYAARELRPG